MASTIELQKNREIPASDPRVPLAPVLAEGAWLLAALMVPLAFEPHATLHFVPLKSALFHLAGLLGWAAIAIHLVAKTRANETSAFFPSGWVLAATAFFLVTAAASTFLSIDPSRTAVSRTMVSFAGPARFYEAGLFLTIVCFLRDRAQLHRLVSVLLLASLPIGLLALAEIYGLAPNHFATRRYGLTSFAAGPIFLAGYLAMMMPLCAWRLRECVRAANGKLDRATLLFAGLLALQFIAFLGTEKRGPFLAVAISLMFGTVFVAWIANQWRWVKRAAIIGCALGAVLVGLAVMQQLEVNMEGVPWVSRLARIVPIGQGTGDPFRQTLWLAVSERIFSTEPLIEPSGRPDAHAGLRFLFGFGPDTVRSVLPSSWVWIPVWPTTMLEVSCHSLFWDVFLSLGLVGVIAMFWLLFEIFFAGLSAIGVPRTNRLRLGVFSTCALCSGGAGIGMAALYDAGYSGLGFALGFLGGFPAFLILRRSPMEPTVRRSIDPGTQWLVVALLTGLTAHWIDMEFVFPTGNTNFLFWMFGGMVVAIGSWKTDAEVRSPSRLDGGVLAVVLGSILVILLCHAFIEFPRDLILGSLPIPWGGRAFEAALALLIVVIPSWALAARWLNRDFTNGKRSALIAIVSGVVGILYCLLKWSILAASVNTNLCPALLTQSTVLVVPLSFSVAVAILVWTSSSRLFAKWIATALITSAFAWIVTGINGNALRSESLAYLAGRFQSAGLPAESADLFRKALALDAGNTLLRTRYVHTRSAGDEDIAGIIAKGLEVSEFNELNQSLGDHYLRRAARTNAPATRIVYALRARYAYSQAVRYVPQSEAAWFNASIVEREFLNQQDRADRLELMADSVGEKKAAPALNVNPALWGQYYARESQALAGTPLQAYYQTRAIRYLDRTISETRDALDKNNRPGIARDIQRADLFWGYVTRGNLRRASGSEFSAAMDHLHAVRFQPSNVIWSSSMPVDFSTWGLFQSDLPRSFPASLQESKHDPLKARSDAEI